MIMKYSAWIALGMSLLAVLVSTWPRTTVMTSMQGLPFLQGAHPWADSVLAATPSAQLQSQRLALWVGPESQIAPDSIASLAHALGAGSVWFQGASSEQIRQTSRLMGSLGGIPCMIGTLPQRALGDAPALPGGLSLAASPSMQPLAGLASTLSVSARAVGMSAVGVPACMASFQSPFPESMLLPAREVSRLLAGQKMLPVLAEASQWEPMFSEDSATRVRWMGAVKEWVKSPVAIWIVETPVGQELGLPAVVASLREKLGFQGLIMGKLPVNADADQVLDQSRRMLSAGVDLLMGTPEALAIIRQSTLLTNTEGKKARTGTQAIRPFLYAKEWTGLSQPDTLPAVHPARLQWQMQALLEATASYLPASSGFLPVQNLPKRSVHVVGIGSSAEDFLTTLRKYFPVSSSSGKLADPWFSMASVRLQKYDPLIIVFGDSFPEGIAEKAMWDKIGELATATPVVIVNLGAPERLRNCPQQADVLQGYDAGPMGQMVAAQMVAGGLPVQGRFPLALTPRFLAGTEKKTEAIRLSYGLPEAQGLASSDFARIDSIVWMAIQNMATPGAQVFVARKGRVIYHRSFGYHDYQRKRGVYPTDLYDVASITKIAATTLAAMSMVDQGKIALDKPLAQYFRSIYTMMDSASLVDTLFWGSRTLAKSLPDSIKRFLVAGIDPGQIDSLLVGEDSLMVISTWSRGKIRRKSPVMSTTLFELLTHTSGLPAGLPLRPFFRGRKTWRQNKQYFAAKPDSTFSIPIAKDLYLRSDMADSIWAMALAMGRQEREGYLYSDANLILAQRLIDSVNKEPLSAYLDRTWYGPMGLQHTCFRPLDRFEEGRIVPTEIDQRYRNQLLVGHVHDPTAALMGGISGNAGLFSTAEDLGVLGQMWLQGGQYGGVQWVSSTTVKQFTQTQAAHRGLGFDKPPREGDYLMAPSASQSSFGHSGFTGTLLWVDPEEELVFVFLSNRVHPQASNWLLNQMGVRQQVHEAIYQAIRNSSQGQDLP